MDKDVFVVVTVVVADVSRFFNTRSYLSVFADVFHEKVTVLTESALLPEPTTQTELLTGDVNTALAGTGIDGAGVDFLPHP
jgi:hypothetical protein